MWRGDNVGGLGKHVTYHMFWFLERPFPLSLHLGLHSAIARRPILTIYTSSGVFPRKDMSFGVPLLPLAT